MPEFGNFEQKAGFTGIFEVKKAERREQQELELPELMESVQEERPKKTKPKDGKGKKKKKKKQVPASCTLSRTGANKPRPLRPAGAW